VPPGPGDLHVLTQAILDAAIEGLDTIPSYEPDLVGCPDRHFVSPGIPVNDFVAADCCSQLAIWVQPSQELGTTPGGLDAGRRSARYAWKNDVHFSLAISRCIPVGSSSATAVFTPPTAEALTEASRQHHADHWSLWNHMHNAVNAEDIMSLCDNVTILTMVPAVPAGGCSGWVMSLAAALDGYSEPVGS